MNKNIIDIEFKSPEKIKLYQEELLRKQLIYLNDKSPYYKNLFAKNNIDISKIETIEDLQYLPFTEKKSCKCTMKRFFVFLNLKL